ncbi:electron transporter RnfE [Sulfurifustis variabilis]|uniref:Electron transporter RnfE n=1 Tax=Sulfurifustis variabilis TaxID=1675686 RepID=A0A1B4V815_9GAMM|nr:SHOCT domain-containing protein [Sulfurifustis variabilis]BAU49669.1 electron transporter RnfE [Sulfurifustis variabilis]
MMMPGPMGGWDGGLALLLLFLGLIVLAVVLLVRRLGGGTGRGGTIREGRSALRILEERYARGEVERQEFERKRRDLTG